MPDFNVLFEAQKANQFAVGASTYKTRINKLNKLQDALENTYKQAIREALFSDFKKPFLETDLTEIFPVVGEIKFAKHHLKQWLKPQKVNTPLTLLGSTSRIVYEPKGVCLILSPWNFPVNLTFSPLVSAIAAGNTVVLKPSEITPHASAVMEEIISSIFEPNEIVVVQGGVDVAEALLKLPFNHIFFTGSPRVGKLVMKAAAEHLSSITLELGGKSPTLIDESANIASAARRIAWGKYLNSGQICVAPDYVLIHETMKADFISAFKKQITKFYTENALTSPSYGRIVNENHFKRLANYIEQAKTTTAVIEAGGHIEAAENYISPTLISNLSDSDPLFDEEIFGPILPIKTYSKIEEAIDYINSKEKPLALYMFSNSKKAIDQVIQNTRAGTTAINNSILQYTNHNLPFGGSNNSGIGKSHGVFGFEAFSNRRAVLHQHIKGAIELLFPPYNNWKQKLADLTIKWF